MRRVLARNQQGTVLSFPPFTWAVMWIIAINLAIYITVLLLDKGNFYPSLSAILKYGALVPAAVVSKGWIWQTVTYAFVHMSFLHFLYNMFTIWMFGATMEQTWGTKRFLQLYSSGVIGAALVTIAVSYSGVLGLSPGTITIGASGGVYGILLAFAMTFPESEIMMFPFPMTMKAKYYVAILILFTLLSSTAEQSGVAHAAHLGGLVFAYLYLKFVHQRGRSYATTAGRYVGRGLSDRAWAPAPAKKPGFLARLRDEYYRWKRRRAAKKFEVYMAKHDRRVFFDEHGNYIPSDDEPPKKDNGESKGPWVN
ncbi:MAG: rhomboid family intramembrane serine protease [Acidobacteriales bacterium]|nr:rhomboid family intramembrane serine protease [Terriglobales bacterium]